MEKRDDVYKNRGLHEYGDVEFADNVNKKYPIDTLSLIHISEPTRH